MSSQGLCYFVVLGIYHLWSMTTEIEIDCRILNQYWKVARESPLLSLYQNGTSREKTM